MLRNLAMYQAKLSLSVDFLGLLHRWTRAQRINEILTIIHATLAGFRHLKSGLKVGMSSIGIRLRVFSKCLHLVLQIYHLLIRSEVVQRKTAKMVLCGGASLAQHRGYRVLAQFYSRQVNLVKVQTSSYAQSYLFFSSTRIQSFHAALSASQSRSLISRSRSLTSYNLALRAHCENSQFMLVLLCMIFHTHSNYRPMEHFDSSQIFRSLVITCAVSELVPTTLSADITHETKQSNNAVRLSKPYPKT